MAQRLLGLVDTLPLPDCSFLYFLYIFQILFGNSLTLQEIKSHETYLVLEINTDVLQNSNGRKGQEKNLW